MIALESLVGYLAALAMGVVLGLLGGGGSILTVPILVYLCEVNAVLASAYSLWVVGIAAFVGAVRYSRLQLVSYKVVLCFGVPSVLGVVLARSVLLPGIPERVFQIGEFEFTRELMILTLFALLMIAAGVIMISQRSLEDRLTTEDWRAEQPSGWTGQVNTREGWMISIDGLLVGLITGLVGAGGGFLIVPVLVMLLGLPIRIAIGTSLAIIFVKSLFGVAVDAQLWRDADWQFLWRFTAAAIMGIVLGGLIAIRIPSRPLMVGFGWFVLVLGLVILSKELVL